MTIVAAKTRTRLRRLLGWRGLALLAASAVLFVLAVVLFGTRMPLDSHRGPLPALDAATEGLAGELRRDTEHLSGQIGERNVGRPEALRRAAEWVFDQFNATGLYAERQQFDTNGVQCQNILAYAPGPAPAIFVVGAHYDSAIGTPGADDNATGVAALLALARRFAKRPRQRSLVFVAFANEEPPWFQGPQMGSVRALNLLRERKAEIQGMVSLETLGYYSDAPGSQRYPAPLHLLYPSTGNFVAFVGNMRSRDLVRSSVEAFRAAEPFPSEGAALPDLLPGIGWSDHWAFWQQDIPAIMATDTAPFRNPHYHQPTDRIAELDFQRLARVVRGLEKVIELAQKDR